MYRALDIPPQLWVSDGESNREGALTNVVVETEISPGVWEVSGSVPYQVQSTNESGTGMGAHPQTWLGQVSTTTVQIDAQWTTITVPVGQTRYMVIRKKPGEADGQWYLNRNSGPA
jgi:hypothetical protein